MKVYKKPWGKIRYETIPVVRKLLTDSEWGLLSDIMPIAGENGNIVFLTNTDIGNLFNKTREYVSRTFKKFDSLNIAHKKGKAIFINPIIVFCGDEAEEDKAHAIYDKNFSNRLIGEGYKNER